MQTAKDFVATSSVIQGIVSLFESKPEIKADTPIMGLPAWTFLVGGIVFLVWNKQQHDTKDKKICELYGKIEELSAKLSEIQRDDKDAMRHEISNLKRQLESRDT